MLAGTAGFRVVVGADPYGFVQKFLLAGIICQSLKFLLSHFDTSATKLRIKLKGGGWVKISDLMCRKGEQVKFKIFVMQIKSPTLPCPPAENKVIDFYIKILYNNRMNIMRKCFPPQE